MMSKIFDINTIVASVGVVMATMSFITGLQVVMRDQKAAEMMKGMHKLNGYLTCSVYIAVAVLSLNGSGGIRLWPVIGWSAGLGLIIVKILVVRNERFYKYASRLGMLLFITWLFIIYRHITT